MWLGVQYVLDGLKKNFYFLIVIQIVCSSPANISIIIHLFDICVHHPRCQILIMLYFSKSLQDSRTVTKNKISLLVLNRKSVKLGKTNENKQRDE